MVAVIFAAASAFLLFIGANLSTVMTGMCNGNLKPSLTYITNAANDFKMFDTQARTWTSTFMCTSLCPCKPTVIP